MTNRRSKVALAAFGILTVALVAVGISLVPAFQTATNGGSTTATSSFACSGPTQRYGNLTFSVSPCASYGFSSPILKNATLASRPVQAFIKTAYEYHVVYYSTSRTDGNVMYAILNVTGGQVVRGNWSSGYAVSYVGNKLLNITVVHVAASIYLVTHVSAYDLPTRNASLDYTPQQGQAIQVALSDPTVKALMVKPPYYVELAVSVGNSSAGEPRLVQLYQVDGTGVVGAFVNPSLGSVTSTYSEQRVSGECWPSGLVIADPWSAASYISCAVHRTSTAGQAAAPAS